MRIYKLAAGLLALAPVMLADLTVDQKVSDFMELAGLYAKNYGPYELKLTLYGFDLFNVSPWLDQVKASKTDIDFYDICVKYVASLRDSHDEFTIRSTFDAWLHFDGDIYEGKFLIDFIDRVYLTRPKYPFAIGDELVSVDGVTVADLLKKFDPYSVNGASNPVSRARLAAGTITERYQGWNPRATEIGKDATIVVRRQGTGAVETYTITWDVFGDPLTTAGRVPSPHSNTPADQTAIRKRLPRPGEGIVRRRGIESDGDGSGPWGVYFTGIGPELTPDPPTPDYMKALEPLHNMSAAAGPKTFGSLSGLSPFGSQVPVFSPPSGFKLRLGALSTDQFLSGTFPVGTKTVGYIRIWTMSPTNTTAAVNQFANEIVFFQQNTDGLVIDLMGNGGGSICYTESLESMLMPGTPRRTTEEIRATLQWQTSFASSVANAKAANAPQYVIDLYQFYLNVINSALKDNRATTGALPLCSYSLELQPTRDTKGNIIVYTKPILVVVDNFTLSAGELLTMFLQDNKRATIFGTQTDGGGGNVVSYNAGSYSEGFTRMTQGVARRLSSFAAPGFPSIPYYDGVGITPDIVQDYMTASNLQTGGADFVKAITAAVAKLIQ
jgi:hypothetical protein